MYRRLKVHCTADSDEEEQDEELDLNDPDLLADGGEPDQDLEDLDDLDADDDLDEDQDVADDDGMGIFRQALDQSARPVDTDAGDLLEDDSAVTADKTAGLSKHERQQLRMQERIAKLEAQNMAAKDWFMQGESGAGEPPELPLTELHLTCMTQTFVGT